MRKFVIFLLVIIATMIAWKYIGGYIKKRALQTAPVSAVNDSLDAVSGYVPTEIQNKKAMENKINDSVQQENDRLKNSLAN